MVQLLDAPGAVAETVRTEVRPRRAVRALPFLVAAATAAVYGTFAILQWRRFESPSWDLGIFTELAQDYSVLHAPVVPIKGPGFNLLGDHFSPILVLLGPVYRVFPSPVTLLLLQVLLLAASVYVVTALAARRLALPVAATIGTAYGLSFGLQGAVSVQFHEVAFAVPLLALSLGAVVSDRPRRAALFALPLLLVKEDLGLTVAVIGVLLLARHARRWGLALVLAGVGGFLLVTVVLIPAFNPGHGWRYSDTIPVGLYLSHPWSLITSLGDPRKVQTVALLLGTAGVIGCRSLTFLAVIPTLLWRFYSTNSGYYGYQWHYSAVLMPIAAVALIDVLSRWNGRGARRRAVTIAVAASVALATGLLTPDPPLGRLLQPSAYATTPRIAAARNAVALVRPGRVVVSDSSLIAYLAAKDETYYAGVSGIAAPDYYVIDAVGGGWGSPPKDLARFAESQYPGHRYASLYSSNGYEVAAKVD
jgi:uncharacterized membrane protein